MKTLIWCLFLLFFVPTGLFAHAVKGKLAPAEAICAEFSFDDGEPMSYAEVTIKLQGEKLSFQKGRTDANGRFCFYPETKAAYSIMVSDGMGHGMELTTEANIEEVSSLQKKEQQSWMISWAKIFLGIFTIFAISGSIVMIRKRHVE